MSVVKREQVGEGGSRIMPYFWKVLPEQLGLAGAEQSWGSKNQKGTPF